MTDFLMLTVILLPALAGILVKLLKFPSRRAMTLFTGTALALEAAAATALSLSEPDTLLLFSMTDTLKVSLRMDGTSRLFLLIGAWGFLLAGIFAFRYLEGEEEEGTFPEANFYLFYLLSLGALAGMDLSGNLISMYFFFEMITLLSMPLVLHEKSRESINAALKYLFYSVAGAFLALLCIFFLSRYSTSLDFAAGGNLDMEKAAGHEKLLLTVIFLGVAGFGAKAGMYPLHGWLPTAHPVAPAPASAVLSGIIAKAGVLAILRIIYCSVGADFLRGTWVQTAWLALALLTVFMGSMMAYREKVFKKRLAYSSVSQISYVLFGLFLLNGTGLTGGLMQILFHATVKICLFLTAGSFIHLFNYRQVDELRGIGKIMPVTLTAFTLASLSLIGIPPFAGFVSKWYLAEGSLLTEIPVLSWLGPVVLLVSALLTAGYLLPITVAGFFPGSDAVIKAPGTELQKKEGGVCFLLPLLLLAVLSLLLGIFGGAVRDWAEVIVTEIL